ncbi:MAG: hypothetical protein QOI51_1815 [Nocardioidaceae bacterium]|nr:hypothetical protein [Nocardioidaceae bacterium]MDX6308998.1 hypothetical protein [Nocardioidaceae bacterium]
MDGTALALVLTAALVHAVWNLAAKNVQGNGAEFVFLYVTVSSAACLPLAVGYVVIEGQRPQWVWLTAALVTAACHVLYGTALQHGYTVGDLTVVYPVARGSGPLITVLVAVVLLGERPGVLGLVGALLIVAGVFVVGTAGRGRAGRAARRRGVVWGLLTGCTIAAYTLWDNHSVNALAVPPLPYFAVAVVFQSAILAPYAVRRPTTAEIWRRHRREVLTVGILSPVAYLLVLYAMQRAPVSLVAPARELSIVFGGLGAWLLYHEPNPVRRLVGSLIVLAGIASIALS